MKHIDEPGPNRCYLFDGLFAGCIAMFSITTSDNDMFSIAANHHGLYKIPAYWFAGAFFIAAFTHVIGWWGGDKVAWFGMKAKTCLALINLLGFIIIAGHMFATNASPTSFVVVNDIAGIVVLMLWLWLRLSIL